MAAVMHATIAMHLCLGSKRTLSGALMQTLVLEVVKLTVRFQKTSDRALWRSRPLAQMKGVYRLFKW
jgi:hypothetical protein